MEIPTSATFLPTNLHTILAGYTNPYIIQYDMETVFYFLRTLLGEKQISIGN